MRSYFLAAVLAVIPAFAFAGNCHHAVVQQIVAQPVVTYVQPVRQVQFVEVPAVQHVVVQQQKVVAQPVVVNHHAVAVQQVKVQRVQQQRSVQRSRSVSRTGGIF